MNLSQDFVHIIVSTHFRNFNSQFVHDILAHGETSGTGSVLHVGKRIQCTAETAGVQVNRIDNFKSALSVFFNQIVQSCSIVVTYNSSQLAVNVIIVQHIDGFTGSKSQIDLFCVLTADKLDFNTDFLAGNLADSGGNLVAVFGIGTADTPYHQLYNLAVILTAAGIFGTCAFIGSACIV